MASTQNYLALISQYESGNQNVANYQYGPGSTAQGYYQITNTNWTSIAPLLGIDTSVYPTAMSAPQSVQAQVAAYLLTQTPAGVSNWSAYNPSLASALSAAGLQTSGQVTDFGTAGGATPLIDLSGVAATTPTADLLSQLETTTASVFGTDTSTAGLILMGLAGLAALLVVRK